jgi:hypothetical protein
MSAGVVCLSCENCYLKRSKVQIGDGNKFMTNIQYKPYCDTHEFYIEESVKDCEEYVRCHYLNQDKREVLKNE